MLCSTSVYIKQIVFQILLVLTMPKHFRRCNFCLTSTLEQPKLVIFQVTDKVKKKFNLCLENDYYVCENHYNPNDLRKHGESKRVISGAIPNILPLITNGTVTVCDQVTTSQLDMVYFHW